MSGKNENNNRIDMTRDRNKKIWKVEYNVLNLPEEIQFNDGHIVRYTYAADGRKLRVAYLESNLAIVEPGDISGAGSLLNGVMGGGTSPFHPFDPPGPVVPPGPATTTLLTMDYCGSHVYRNGELERTMNDYGYQADSTYYYYIKDYQGNVRAVIDQNGSLKEIDNYYPYGGLMGAASAGVHPNKYGGKELDRENGIDWYDFEARYQDPMLPMFTTQDPLAEQTPSISPYAYCAGNPIRYVDPTGMVFIDEQGVGQFYYEYLNAQICSISEAINAGTVNIDVGSKLLNEYKNAVEEYDIMMESDQIYRISLNCSEDLVESRGAINYNPVDKSIDMTVYISLIPSACGIIAHEFKHMYQFEVGKISFDAKDGSPGRLYSEKDEIDAYNRQSIIENGQEHYNNQDKYKITKKKLYSDYERLDYGTAFKNARNNTNDNVLRIKQGGKFKTILHKYE